MDFSVICRTCLIDVKKEPVDLTEQLWNFLENDLGLQEVPRSHSQLDLPTSICLSCYRSLVTFERFFAQCKNAQKFLKCKLKSVSQIKEPEDYMDAGLSDIEELRDDNVELGTIVIEFEALNDNENPRQKDNDDILEIIEEAHPITDPTDEENEENCTYLEEGIDEVDAESNDKKIDKISVLYVCKVCEKEFNGKGDLRKHEMTHPGMRPFVCKVCGAAFKDRTAINYHMTTHFGKLFPCTMCDKKCATRSMLRSHIRYTHGCQNFQCDQCGQIFKTGHLLSCHQTKHNGTQQYVCKFCTNAYFNRHDLLSHVKHVHIYYVCKICGTTYKKLIRIRNHLKNNHEKKENADEYFTKNYGI